MDLSEFLRQQHGLRVERLPDGRNHIMVEPDQGCDGARSSWTTGYPPELILEIHATKRGYVCDEIQREEDPRYVEHAIRHEVLGYIDAEAFRGKRILDFGCGAGASTLVMSRLLPPCELVGVELEERLLRLARLRAEHLGKSALQFFLSPSGTALPAGLGKFDYIVLSAGGAALLKPKHGDQVDLWYGKLSRRYAWLKRSIWAALKALKPIAGIHLVPELTLALRKLG